MSAHTTDKFEITRHIDELDVARFLSEHWQKKPLLIRHAFPDFEPFLSPEELAGLACEEDVESRLIIADAAAEKFTLRSGPFSESDFSSLPETGWTLLVQDVEKHLPELAEILDHFRFIPSWRIDDLMISYATRDGGVGPHTDHYDVFLLQASGQRRWQVAENFDPELIEGIDLKVLKTFKPEQDWVLNPGDMLYLPPGVAHNGVAVDSDCMTWSIGFRAPEAQDMLTDLVELLQQRLPNDRMYEDPDLSPEEAADGQISPAARERARKLVRDMLTMDDAFIDEWFGRFVTEPKHWLETPAPESPWSEDNLLAWQAMERDTRTRLNWMQAERNCVLLIDGAAWHVESELRDLLALLCRERHYSCAMLEPWLDQAAARTLLLRLANHGVLRPLPE